MSNESGDSPPYDYTDDEEDSIYFTENGLPRHICRCNAHNNQTETHIPDAVSGDANIPTQSVYVVASPGIQVPIHPSAPPPSQVAPPANTNQIIFKGSYYYSIPFHSTSGSVSEMDNYQQPAVSPQTAQSVQPASQIHIQNGQGYQPQVLEPAVYANPQTFYQVPQVPQVPQVHSDPRIVQPAPATPISAQHSMVYATQHQQPVSPFASGHTTAPAMTYIMPYYASHGPAPVTIQSVPHGPALVTIQPASYGPAPVTIQSAPHGPAPVTIQLAPVHTQQQSPSSVQTSPPPSDSQPPRPVLSKGKSVFASIIINRNGARTESESSVEPEEPSSASSSESLSSESASDSSSGSSQRRQRADSSDEDSEPDDNSRRKRLSRFPPTLNEFIGRLPKNYGSEFNSILSAPTRISAPTSTYRPATQTAKEKFVTIVYKTEDGLEIHQMGCQLLESDEYGSDDTESSINEDDEEEEEEEEEGEEEYGEEPGEGLRQMIYYEDSSSELDSDAIEEFNAAGFDYYNPPTSDSNHPIRRMTREQRELCYQRIFEGSEDEDLMVSIMAEKYRYRFLTRHANKIGVLVGRLTHFTAIALVGQDWAGEGIVYERSRGPFDGRLFDPETVDVFVENITSGYLMGEVANAMDHEFGTPDHDGGYLEDEAEYFRKYGPHVDCRLFNRPHNFFRMFRFRRAAADGRVPILAVGIKPINDEEGDSGFPETGLDGMGGTVGLEHLEALADGRRSPDSTMDMPVRVSAYSSWVRESHLSSDADAAAAAASTALSGSPATSPIGSASAPGSGSDAGSDADADDFLLEFTSENAIFKTLLDELRETTAKELCDDPEVRAAESRKDSRIYVIASVRDYQRVEDDDPDYNQETDDEEAGPSCQPSSSTSDSEEGGRRWAVHIIAGMFDLDHPIISRRERVVDVPSFAELVDLDGYLDHVDNCIVSQRDLGLAYNTFVLGETPDTKEVCHICLDGYTAGQECRRLRRCKHVFHKTCIDSWLLGSRNTCPFCRGQGVKRAPTSWFSSGSSDEELEFSDD
ncbi:ubiquitin-protein ligase E3 (predicted) [Sugiyamaella lignohabitans]|uniref:Ubiquitin-protein ligase E3 (Predicted) n=1 Tax=Sugiyamaella lignohabitans TaxID=796027 RepID=A0A161HKH3_9ASCO|nr:ubiquitin-protein ligase E3 (predicted) [Sugiyamaella lignohabitans]ANB12198.1 ubiquitin-protein ligase E3 (predicted) [Sugiyamaella lignohabitans]